MFIVMCEKSGGVTGYGLTELKNDGKIVEFATKEEATIRANELNVKMNHMYATAFYHYWVEERHSTGVRGAWTDNEL